MFLFLAHSQDFTLSETPINRREEVAWQLHLESLIEYPVGNVLLNNYFIPECAFGISNHYKV